MFCPECGAEFREGFSRCNQCDVALIEDRPAEVDEDPAVRSLAVFGTYLWLPEAVVVHGALRGAGFHAWLWDEHLASIFWNVILATGGAHVVVDADELEDAEAWLSAAASEPQPEAPEEYRRSWKEVGVVVLAWIYVVTNPVALVLGLIILTDIAYAAKSTVDRRCKGSIT